MKCQILFSGKNKKNIIYLLSDELAQRELKVKIFYLVCFGLCVIIVAKLLWCRIYSKYSDRETVMPASVAQSDARPTGDQEGAGSNPITPGNILLWR